MQTRLLLVLLATVLLGPGVGGVSADDEPRGVAARGAQEPGAESRSQPTRP